jgi:hypothetical protein
MRNRTSDTPKGTEDGMKMDFRLEPIKRVIRASFPDLDISVVDNARDDVGGVLYVKNAPSEFASSMGLSMDFVMVPLDDRNKSEFLVVPIPEQEPEVPPSPAAIRF